MEATGLIVDLRVELSRCWSLPLVLVCLRKAFEEFGQFSEILVSASAVLGTVPIHCLIDPSIIYEFMVIILRQQGGRIACKGELALITMPLLLVAPVLALQNPQQSIAQYGLSLQFLFCLLRARRRSSLLTRRFPVDTRLR